MVSCSGLAIFPLRAQCFVAISSTASRTLLTETKPEPPPSPCDQKPRARLPKNNDYGLGTGIRGRQLGALDILSDTQGVDFGPYLQKMLQTVRDNWYSHIPDSARMKSGRLAIEFAITKDGQVADMRLVASSGDVELDRPAWESITASNPFSPLPGEFTGSYLALRFRFYYNPDDSDLSPPGFRKLAISVSISAPGTLEEVPLGSTKPVTVVVTGAGKKKNAVEWTVSGIGCLGTSCGEVTKDSYLAPRVMPDPPCVTLTAVSKADRTAKASVTVHIVQPAAQTSSRP